MNYMYLTEEEADRLFMSGMIARGMDRSLMSKQAAAASLLSSGLGAAKSLAGAVGKAITTAPAAAGATLMGSISAGVVAGIGYNIIKNRLISEPYYKEDEVNSATAIYKGKSRELADSRWIKDVRSKRDDIVRNMKKMSPEEYEKAYNELSNLLDERK